MGHTEEFGLDLYLNLKIDQFQFLAQYSSIPVFQQASG
jgi:hypothetical protein